MPQRSPRKDLGLGAPSYEASPHFVPEAPLTELETMTQAPKSNLELVEACDRSDAARVHQLQALIVQLDFPTILHSVATVPTPILTTRSSYRTMIAHTAFYYPQLSS